MLLNTLSMNARHATCLKTCPVLAPCSCRRAIASGIASPTMNVNAG
jgi:hypothetical protein